MIQSNPFIKRKTLDASERIKQKKTRSMMQTLNTKPSTTITKNYVLENNKVKQVKDHTLHMEYTQGYYGLECNCDNEMKQPNITSDGIYSVLDVSAAELNSTNALCRDEKHLIIPTATLEPSVVERKFNYPVPLAKTTPSNCCEPVVNRKSIVVVP